MFLLPLPGKFSPPLLLKKICERPCSRGFRSREIWNPRMPKSPNKAQIRPKLCFLSLFSGPRIVKTVNSKTANNEDRLYNSIFLIKTYLFRKCQLFFSLCLMDTGNHQNYNLMEEIKTEAMDSNILEAFLESAPQVLVQLSALPNYGLTTGKYVQCTVYTRV
jgi:hypothetical protein